MSRVKPVSQSALEPYIWRNPSWTREIVPVDRRWWWPKPIRLACHGWLRPGRRLDAHESKHAHAAHGVSSIPPQGSGTLRLPVSPRS